MNKPQKYLLGAAVGGILGYGYYYFIGCSTGDCAITSNWHISTLYGIAVGMLFVMPGKKKKGDCCKDKEEVARIRKKRLLNED